jgi:hypothetical protein
MNNEVKVNLLHTLREDNLNNYSLSDMVEITKKIDFEDKTGNFQRSIFSPMIDAEKGFPYKVRVSELTEILSLLSQNKKFRSLGEKGTLLLDPMNIGTFKGEINSVITELGLNEQITEISENILRNVLRVTHDRLALAPQDSVHFTTYNTRGIQLNTPLDLLGVKKELELKGRYELKHAA